jgi:hypothetical protein
VFAVLLGGALLGIPSLLLQSGSAVASRAATDVASSSSAWRGAARHHPVSLGSSSSALARYRAPASTPTSVPPATTTTVPATTTTTGGPQAQAIVDPPATTTVPPTTTTTTTTTTLPPPPPTTTTVPVPIFSEVGEATWYAEAPDGMCASPDLPFGTVLTVTDNATGASIDCTVDDREAQNPGRVVDLSPEGFAQLAPTSQGVIMVTISW